MASQSHDREAGKRVINTWDSHAEKPSAFLESLPWLPEAPSIYHTVKLAFTPSTDPNVSYRRLTFPDGSHMYSRLEHRSVAG